MIKTYIVKLDKDYKQVDGVPTKAVKVNKELDDRGNTVWFTTMEPMEAFFDIKDEGLYCEICHLMDAHRITIYEEKKVGKMKVLKGGK